ncbi:MAG: transketolase [Candidatus Yonathbacteria bacterium RIFCSPHIGHO2_01_FULL_44_41]|uniref:Transketolase n=1 Tax=Candidatus Yonathbacteria bacterium RIFCSPHIGHO2_02_FULL_44_14 TaxID=1802724 RepID=A0A1G2S774_9BACT|nr:MAG: transketolase [Candidatus Yonathbacteria bacterium RIFCSPHIGHO2_01_FULL_44_41]OHA80974.1 MAG: transketolase [Candidatus Yonathbacteria bacterium RIFCSPHIGHO2_02_FULL_44_14]OHA82407.1 MAG: transketolase [Candidatus Yonathbacteria bacterium RIFCSPLOWO2_01_FULL_43_20]
MNLNPKLFDADVEQAPIRQGFGEGLVIAGRADERVVAMCCDLTESTKMDAFAREFPNRFFEMGIMEQSAASVASGMAAMGKVPFVSSYAMFSPGRNWEQIRTTICYNNRPVKIAGSHSGVSVGPDGGTHQAVEDITLTRVIPRMVVITPCDSIEARKATLAMAKTNSPTYIRLAREKTPIITTEDTPFEIGKAQEFFRAENPKVGIIACGSLVYNTLMAAKELETEGVGAVVLNMGTIKPLDRATVIALAKECGAIVTVEEHQIAGGMGSAVAEVLASEHPTRMAFVGVHDKFGQSGTPEELLKHYGMDKDAIIQAVKSLL